MGALACLLVCSPTFSWPIREVTQSLTRHPATTNVVRGDSDRTVAQHCKIDAALHSDVLASRRAAKAFCAMEQVVQLHIEKLPEGVYLATSDEVQGLVDQGRTLQETIEIARDVAKKLMEAKALRSAAAGLTRLRRPPSTGR